MLAAIDRRERKSSDLFQAYNFRGRVDGARPPRVPGDRPRGRAGPRDRAVAPREPAGIALRLHPLHDSTHGRERRPAADGFQPSSAGIDARIACERRDA